MRGNVVLGLCCCEFMGCRGMLYLDYTAVNLWDEGECCTWTMQCIHGMRGMYLDYAAVNLSDAGECKHSSFC